MYVVFSISVRLRTHLRNVSTGHRSTVKTQKLDTHVGQHFNLPNHSISDMILQGIEALVNRRESVRLSREKDVDQACPHHSPPWSQHTGRKLLISPLFSPFFFPHRNYLHLFYIYFYICSTFVLFVSLFVSFVLHPLSDSLLLNLMITSSSINSWYLYSHLISFVWSQDQHLTLLLLSSSFVFISHLTNFLSYSVFSKEPARFET